MMHKPRSCSFSGRSTTKRNVNHNHCLTCGKLGQISHDCPFFSEDEAFPKARMAVEDDRESVTFKILTHTAAMAVRRTMPKAAAISEPTIEVALGMTPTTREQTLPRTSTLRHRTIWHIYTVSLKK